MPEGDTIHYAAHRMRPVLEGRVPDELATPHPRFGADRWPEKLAGRAIEAVDAHGKHLFLRFEGGRVIHSHLRMTGAWGVYREGQRWGARRGARGSSCAPAGHDVVQFDGPVLELMTASRVRFDQRIAGLGPTSSRPSSTRPLPLAPARRRPTRPIGDALLDQRTIAGIGNLWKCEGCFDAELDPWRPAGEVSDDEALRVVRLTRPRMQQSARDGFQVRGPAIYGRVGRPCPRCGARSARGQGEDNRPTYWCPGCQH
jgi:endonuclease-8